MVKAKVGGTWQDADYFVRNSGAWQDADIAPLPTAAATTFAKGMNGNLASGDAVTEKLSWLQYLGCTYVREDWDPANTTPPVDLTALAANGQTLLPLLNGNSAAMSGDLTTWGNQVKAVVAAHPELTWWEVWNEPYLAYTGLNCEPYTYADVFKAAVTAGRQGNPNAKFLIAVTVSDSATNVPGYANRWGDTWIQDMFTHASDLGQYIDGFVVHDYCGDPDLPEGSRQWLNTAGDYGFTQVDVAKSLFEDQGVTDVPCWVTEMGWYEKSGGSGDKPNPLPSSTIATYYTRFFNQVAQRPWIQAVFPYDLMSYYRDYPDVQYPSEDSFGLYQMNLDRTWVKHQQADAVKVGFTNF